MSVTFLDVKCRAEGLPIEAGVAGIYPVPLETIALHLGFSPVAFEGGDDVSGAINHAERVIYVNSNESPVRQRFTLAHEIGHAALHAGESVIDYRKNIDSPDPNNTKEVQANQFAANLLMPSDDFIEVWRSRGGDAKRVANYFGVSESAATYRAMNLGLAA